MYFYCWVCIISLIIDLIDFNNKQIKLFQVACISNKEYIMFTLSVGLVISLKLVYYKSCQFVYLKIGKIS